MRCCAGVMRQRLFSLFLLPLNSLDFENVLSFPSVLMLCYALQDAQLSTLGLVKLSKALG